MKEKASSINQACRVAQIDRKTYHYKPKRQKDNQMLKGLLKELSIQYPRYGFKTLYLILRNQGHLFNHKRIYRLYCELGLHLKTKPKKRLASRTKHPLEVPQLPNQCWSLDYMTDMLENGRRFRTANVLDDCHRGGLGILVSFSLPATRITRWLDQVAQRHGYPRMIRVDNGPENLSKHFRTWAETHNIQIRYIQPGKPAQNAYIERFNRTYREAVLDMYLFQNIKQAQMLTNNWLAHYNNDRPHQALNNLTPKDFIKNLTLHSNC